MKTQFEMQLLNQIRKYIRTLKSDGTVSMSADNLLQCVRPPSSSVPGAPNGTNAQYFYREMFRRLCGEIKTFNITF